MAAWIHLAGKAVAKGLLIALALSVSVPLASAAEDPGWSAISRGDFAAALQYWQPVAGTEAVTEICAQRVCAVAVKKWILAQDLGKFGC